VSLRYAVVTPARNEEVNLARLGAAMIAQTQPPVVWVVVDDGSTDATLSILHELARSHPWIKPLERTGAIREESLADGLRKARDLDGFLLGAAPLRDEVDVVVKIDADVDFDPDYLEQLVGRFEADPLLGIASGASYERENGKWVRRARVASTVWGQSRAYRSECLADVMTLEPRLGWDALDEVSVQLRGLRTKTFLDLGFRHNRPQGGREGSSLRQAEALGIAAWYMGYRPTYLGLRALYRARRDPAALAMLWGYFHDAVRRVPQCPNRELVRAMRARQRFGATLRRGAPSS
jgi:glycosyltransferase involved in cell wall biosynthesis